MPGSTLRRSGLALLVVLFAALALLAIGCGGDDQPQSITAPQADEQQTQVQPEQNQTVAPASPAPQSDTAADPQPDQQVQVAQAESNGSAEQTTATTATTATTDANPGQDTEPANTREQQTQPAETEDNQADTEPAITETVTEGTRIVTLFGDLTEIVYALGAEEFLVGRDTSSVYPADIDDLPNLGFAGALNAEALLALEPTIVIANSMAGPAGVLEQLEAAGVELLLIETPKQLDAPGIKIRAIGDVLGLPQTAELLAQDVEQRMATVLADAQLVEEPLRVLLIYIRRGGLQLVSGQGNEAQTIIEAAGGIDAGAEAGIVGWQALTPEALVAADPDVYLVMELGLEVIGGIDEFLAIPGMAETTAGRARRVIAMSDLYLLGFGPRLPEAVAELSAYLQTLQEE